MRNNACFDKKLIKNPIEILILACAFMCYWTGRYPEDTQKMIQEGVGLMMKTVIKIMGTSEGAPSVTAILGGGHATSTLGGGTKSA
jgi:hypothetical protein